MQPSFSRSILSTLRTLIGRGQDVRGRSTRHRRRAPSYFLMESLEARVLLSATPADVAPELAIETSPPVVQLAAPAISLQVDLTGSAVAAAQTQGTIYGLDFPGSAAVPNGQTMRFRFDHPELNGLPIYGPDGEGVTYIWQAYVRQQPGYYTTFFWGNDDGVGTINSTFLWDDGFANSYYGMQPYPPGGSSGSAHNWAISVDQLDEQNGTVVTERWYTQVARVWVDPDGSKRHEFYWDWPNADAGHLVEHTSVPEYNNIIPPSPALTFGDAPWQPGQEVWNGILRGVQIYSTKLSLADIQSEITAPGSTSAGADSIWYLNLNPTPTDISDQSGQGHNPTWVGNLRPTLYSLVVNQPPVAANDSYAVPLGTPLIVTDPGVLANDTDPDSGTGMTAVLTTGPANGTLVLNANGGFRYTPNTGFLGLDTFTYQASDGVLLSPAATVTVGVGVPSDQLPSITSNGGGTTAAVNAAENSIIVTTVTATDSDNDPISYSLVGGVDQGKFSIDSVSGVLNFVTAPNFEAPTDADANNVYLVTVQASDGRGGTDVQALSVTVTNINEAPVATNNAYTVQASSTLTIAAPGLLANDSDPDAGTTLTAMLVTTTASGILNFNTNGGFSYTPAAGFTGIDSFTYRVSDGSLQSAPVTVTLTVSAVTGGFTVTPATMIYNGTVNGPNQVAGVTITNNNATNLTVKWSDSISWLIDTSGDTVTIAPGASVFMTHTASMGGRPAGTYTGTATLSGGGVSKQVPVILNIASTTPVIGISPSNLAFSGTTGGLDPAPKTFAISNTGGGTLTWTVSDNATWLTLGPSNGTNAGTVTAAVNLSGLAAGTYNATVTVTAAGATTKTLPVTLTVALKNQAPVANDQTFVVAENRANGTVVGTIVATDPNAGDTKTFAVTGGTGQTAFAVNPTTGQITVVNGNLLNYETTPSLALNVSVTDGGGLTDTAVITINLTNVNEAPTAGNDNYTVAEDTVLTVPAPGVLISDSDPDAGTTLTAAVITGPTKGILTLNGNGSFTYQPTANFTGTDTFTYRISDGSQFSNTATVTVMVTPVNDVPVANSQAVAVSENVAKAITLTGADVDGDPLSVLVVAGPTNGTLTGTGANRTYTPNANYNGLDSFTFKVNDGTIDSNIATVTLTVAPVNNAPTISNPGAQVGTEDVAGTILLTGITPGGGVDESGQSVSVSVSASDPTFFQNLTIGPVVDGQAIIAYTPAFNRNGSVNLTVTVNDGQSQNNTTQAIFALNLAAVNDPPVGTNDSYTTQAQTTLTVTGAGVLANDTDVDTGTTLTAVLETGPAHGTLTLNTNGGFTYTPTAGYLGLDSFTYRASDGTAQSGVTTVALTVTASTPGFTVSPSTLAFIGTANGPNQTAGVTITNTGSTALTVTWKDSIHWLVDTSGDVVTIAPGATATITHTASFVGRAASSYTGNATLTGGGITKTVPVTMTVISTTPVIGLSPTSLAFTGIAGGANPTPKTFAISNTGGGTLSWTVTDNTTWLALSPAGGTNSGTVTANVNLSGLAAGSYNATVTIRATGATTKTLTVTLIVSAT